MTFPDRVLTAEQIAWRASAVLMNLSNQMDAWGGIACIREEARPVVKRVWNRMTRELADARGRIEASK